MKKPLITVEKDGKVIGYASGICKAQQLADQDAAEKGKCRQGDPAGPEAQGISEVLAQGGGHPGQADAVGQPVAPAHH